MWKFQVTLLREEEANNFEMSYFSIIERIYIVIGTYSSSFPHGWRGTRKTIEVYCKYSTTVQI